MSRKKSQATGSTSDEERVPLEMTKSGMHTVYSPLGTGFLIHSPATCQGQSCAFHNPTDHLMLEWSWTLDTNFLYLMVRLCPTHSEWHADPDSWRFLKTTYLGMGAVDGKYCLNCCGCCVW